MTIGTSASELYKVIEGNPVYVQFDAAFSKISAYVVFKGAENVGRVVFKYGNRAHCYAQVWGAPMAHAHASGYGYDKTTAACEVAIARIALRPDSCATPAAPVLRHLAAWQAAMKGKDGETWRRRLEDAGYTVAHAI